MQEKVLILTGGFITSRERSLFQVARKWRAQLSNARSAWLDLKVKLVIAESLVGSMWEKLKLPLRSRSLREQMWEYSKNQGFDDVPSLTEVVLASLLHKAGMPYELMTLDTLFSDPHCADRLLEQTSCVFLSSTYLHDLSELEPIVRRIKRLHNHVVIGGALAGIIAHQWEGMPEIDVLAIGYGEMLIDAIVDWIRSGYRALSPPPTGSLVRKPHTLFLYSGVLQTKDLDFLPAPDWELAERDHKSKFRMIYYESVRGCPYRCNFCNYPYLFGDTKFRYKSARKMADDWEHYVNTLGVEYIICLDSLFTMPRSRVREFCRLLIERRIQVKWICYARADDLADEELVAMMKAAGAHQVQIGIESGDQTLLKNMDKDCTVESNSRALVNCRRHNLTSIVSLIVGFPGESAASLEQTYQFLEATPPDFYFLATFSTRVAGVPLLKPENKRRFGLQVMSNLYSMASYWKHDTMSCTEVGNHVRALDKRIMRNRVALSATLFYRGMLSYSPTQREGLLDFQQHVARKHLVLDPVFDLLNGWVDTRLHRDMEVQFGGGAHTKLEIVAKESR
jgi:radical SAM superfamily enzyme YgiQ (UPF0313 family)